MRPTYKRSDESIEEFHERLKAFYGCSDCDEYGNNGCGCWRIGCFEFNGDDYERFDLKDDCGHRPDTVIAKEIIGEKEKGVHIFKAAIECALELAPNDEARANAYGDIVRSAAAVAVRNMQM